MEPQDNINPVLQPEQPLPDSVSPVPSSSTLPEAPKHFSLKKYIFVIVLLVLLGIFGLGALTVLRVLSSKQAITPTTETTKETSVSTTPTEVGMNSAYSIKIDVDKLVVTESSTGQIFVVSKLPTVPVTNFENDTVKVAFEKNLQNIKVWSGKKTKFAFLDTYEKNRQEVMVFDLEKRTITPVSDADRLLRDQVVWSPEDNKIAYLALNNYGVGGGYFASIYVYDFITKETKNYGEYNAPLNLKWVDNNHLSFEENNASGTFKKTVALDQSSLKYLTLPIFPGSVFVKKEVASAKCLVAIPENCDYLIYQILTPSSLDKVLDWYKNGIGASGWQLGTIAVENSENVAKITKGNDTSQIKLSSEGTSTKVLLYLPMESGQLENMVRQTLKLSAADPVKVIDYESTYAYGNAGVDQGTYWYASRNGLNWSKVVIGNDVITCTDAKLFPLGIFGNRFDKCYEGSTLVDRNLAN